MRKTRQTSHYLAGITAIILLPAISCGTGTELTTELVAEGLARPVFVTAPPGDFDRVFIVESRSGTTGRIRILNLNTGTLNTTPFLQISPVATGNEQGLLGLAFHPNYATNGFFYVNYTNAAGTTVIARYTVSANPDVADAGSALTVLTIAQPQANHNGGWIGFGPDGYLYIASGDGGASNDTGSGHTADTGNAQDITSNLLGKLLRIDVDGDDFPTDANRNYAIPPDNPFVGVSGDDEIWAYGLRNPWRCCFDRATGDLWIADVGQGQREEIDFQPASNTGGANYGWRCMEGTLCTGLTGCTCNAPVLTLPIHEYTHAAGNCSITGGCAYRGAAIWDLRGTYFFADFCSARIWSFRYDGVTIGDFRDRSAELDPPGTLAIGGISSFGEDAAGELYICDLNDGEVFRIVPNGPVVGDMNGDGLINAGDIVAFVLAFTDPTAYAAQYPGIDRAVTGDINLDGVFNAADIPAFVNLLVSG